MFKPLVLMPSYNSGALLESTVRQALTNTQHPVWVVIDGSDDGSDVPVWHLAKQQPRLRILRKDRNEGKGAAVRTGVTAAREEQFTHVLVMDADGQHPAKDIGQMFSLAKAHPCSMILGQPVFDASVPRERLYGRKLSVWLVWFEVLGATIGDPLFGFRVYPIRELLQVMRNPNRGNRYDFDPEVAVRLAWLGVPAVKVDMPVIYIPREQGGITHFHYIRDNVRYVGLHFRLVFEAPVHWIAKCFQTNQPVHDPD